MDVKKYILFCLNIFTEVKKQDGPIAEKLLNSLKCIAPKLPRAENALFILKDDGSIEFEVWNQDDSRPESESGYVSTAVGDSGSSYWTETEDDYGNSRQVIIAVHSSGNKDRRYSIKPSEKCREFVTKVSTDVVTWLGSYFKAE